MSEYPLASQRVLVIEDRPEISQQVKQYIESINAGLLKDNGLHPPAVELADSVVQAEEQLEKAADNPFNLALLDLRIPIKSGAQNPMMQNGFRLLEHILKSGRAKGVVVISNYGDYTNVRKAFTGGAVDFINKPLNMTNIEPAVVNALVRLLNQETERLLNQRIFDLVAHAQLGLAHGFRQVFVTLVKGVTEAAEGIEKDVRERYGLDTAKDPRDSLTLHFSEHQSAITKARQDWAAIQTDLAPASSGFDLGVISHMLRDIKKKLEPALVVNRVTVTETASYDRPVHTFEKDVEVVLNELVAGALSDRKEKLEGREIKISFITQGTRVGVVVEDDLDPINDKHAKVINSGSRIITDPNFSRAWGLSVAQHVALRGGGEINVAIKHGKNVVTYYVPLADHA